MPELPMDEVSRRRMRERIYRETRAELERRARRPYRSLKCSGEVYDPPRCAGTPDGCRNDGSTCLCECHDVKELSGD